jgi:hypothetical protein
MILDWYKITLDAVQDLWQGFLVFTPNLIGAIIVFIIGWFIAIAVGKLITEILRQIKFNQLFENTGWRQALEKAELKVDVSKFVGVVFKWIFIIVTLSISVEILGLNQFAVLLASLIDWLPNLVVAVAIFIVAIIIADISEKITRASVEKLRIGFSQVAGVIVKWSIWIFAILAILMQLGIAKALILTLFTGFVIMLSIAFGLAFGLGGKEIAADILQDLRKKLRG